ncbi:MAG: hypothetical protein C4548_16380 [Desulfobacteraceae bacterium]|jgi:hypothetical protein|nr:MAG: hypothetical protein C4548_16380 [Desulfobacteraceae bacterium]
MSMNKADHFNPVDPDRDTAMHPEYKVDMAYVRDVINGAEPDALLVDTSIYAFTAARPGAPAWPGLSPI